MTDSNFAKPEDKSTKTDLNISMEEFLAMFELLYNIVVNSPGIPRHTIVWVKSLAVRLGFTPTPILPQPKEEDKQIVQPSSVEHLGPDKSVEGESDKPKDITPTPDIESEDYKVEDDPEFQEYMAKLEKLKNRKK